MYQQYKKYNDSQEMVLDPHHQNDKSTGLVHRGKSAINPWKNKQNPDFTKKGRNKKLKSTAKIHGLDEILDSEVDPVITRVANVTSNKPEDMTTWGNNVESLEVDSRSASPSHPGVSTLLSKGREFDTSKLCMSNPVLEAIESNPKM